MFLLDFHATPARAFRHGFLKGLAAPILLFHAESPPTWPALAPLPTANPADALAGDWRRVGDDLRAALARHGKAA